MKVNGFFKDVTGASRVTKARHQLIESGNPENIYKDHIREVAQEVHPKVTHVKCAKVEDVSPTARKFTFVPTDGDVLPPFMAGQYASVELEIPGEDGKVTKTTRPFSISSAPFQARQGDKSFFELTIRNGKPGVGFVSSWMYANCKEGSTFTFHLPLGQFYYEPLRDAKKVVALAGGSGITPFYSMAQEIAHGTMDCDLTILYGSVSTKDIILEKQLSAIQSPRVRFVNVISGEPDYPGEKGFLNADLIRKYSEGDPADGNTTYFVCGPLPMYNFVNGELEKLNVPKRRIRMEVFGAPRDITKDPDYPKRDPAVYKLKVMRGLEETEIKASSLEPLAVAMERAGIPNPTRCRSGACGFCRCKLLKGDVFVPSVGDGRRYADKKFGYYHACSTYPLSDCAIKIEIC
ncbi:MAG: iron-sulfur cluster-binding domain-containing protein [bacterium LCO1.1]|uniref:Iron-sulfur cluster-binding domain-containing protein n=1 Tax=Candidatus Weimeria bifida TaxID=2599074 RepID=A0A6N7IYC0_9FIRM|nr:iron-sulfur cluster-binding domain-containing protein [Candidatus Weimeria bifida]